MADPMQPPTPPRPPRKPPTVRKPTRPRASRPSSPPNRVEPGWLHEALAGATLRAVRDSTGGQLDVGALADDFVTKVPGAGEDGPEPAVILARLYAHAAHRLPLVKRIEKRLEGKEARSGMGSDFLALCAQLYLRNRDLVPGALALVREAAKQRADKGASADKPGANGAGTIPGHWPGETTTPPVAGGERTEP